MASKQIERADQLGLLVAEFEDQHDYSAKDQGLVLGEEAGELCGAILEAYDAKLFRDTARRDVREEVGDVIFTACTIAALYGINPIEAALDTAESNLDREGSRT